MFYPYKIRVVVGQWCSQTEGAGGGGGGAEKVPPPLKGR